METTNMCPLCGKPISPHMVMFHFPQCYRDKCLAEGIVPLCTCNCCKARKSHDGDTLDGNFTSPFSMFPSALLSSPFQDPANKKRKRKEDKPMNPEDKLDPNKKPTPSQLTAKGCIICGTKRSPANTGIPTIHIGKYRDFLVCKKQHIVNDDECGMLIDLIDEELQKVISKNGGKKKNVLLDGSDPDEPSEREKPPVKCNGFLNLEDMTPCNNTTEELLYVEEKGQNIYFCKGSHIIRYIIRYHLSAVKGDDKKQKKLRLKEEKRKEEDIRRRELAKEEEKKKLAALVNAIPTGVPAADLLKLHAAPIVAPQPGGMIQEGTTDYSVGNLIST